MYKLRFNGQDIYDPRGANDADKLIIMDPAVTLAVNSAGSVSFSILPSHPMARKITRMRGTLELVDDDGTLFRGRILNDETTFYGAQKYTAEGALAYLNDSIVDPYTFPDDFVDLPGYQDAAGLSGNLVAWWLAWLLDRHNAQAPADRQIKLGSVTVKDPNNYISRENSKYSSTWQTISEKLVGSALGGYLIMRYEDDGNYLDYLAELPRTNPQRVKFSENLLDIIIKVTGESIFTAILPVGADDLTLAELPDGPLEGGLIKAGKVIYDPAAETEYGSRITRVVTWDDVAVPENLKTKAAAALAAGIQMPESITIQACDLNGVDGLIPHFRVGQYVRVESGPHGLSAAYPLLEMTPNILEPGATTICLNTTTAKFTAAVRQAQITAEEEAKSAVREASKRFNELISKASGFFATPEPQPDGSVIYYLHDKQTLEESTLVMKLTAEAIGFSTDGGSTYPYGFTVTGDMVMNIISSEGLNADWINAGTINLNLLKLLGTLCGIMQGYGMTASGRTTQGIVVYGNGVDDEGNAKPPYLIVTDAGIRLQTTAENDLNIAKDALELNGWASISGNVRAGGDVFGKGYYMSPNGEVLAQITNSGVLQLGGTLDTYIGGKTVYISVAGNDVIIRGNVDFSQAVVSGLNFETVDSTRYYLNGKSVISSSNGYNYFGASGESNVLEGSSVYVGSAGTSSVNIGTSSQNVYIGSSASAGSSVWLRADHLYIKDNAGYNRDLTEGTWTLAQSSNGASIWVWAKPV